MYVAICKGLGSFFAGLTVMMMFPGRYLFVFWFPTVWALDTLYSVMPYRKIRSEGASPWALNRPAVVPDSERTVSGVAPRVSAPAAGGGG